MVSSGEAPWLGPNDDIVTGTAASSAADRSTVAVQAFRLRQELCHLRSATSRTRISDQGTLQLSRPTGQRFRPFDLAFSPPRVYHSKHISGSDTITHKTHDFGMFTEETTFSAESYFASQPPPSTLQHDVERVREFVKRHNNEGRSVVLVTVSPGALEHAQENLIPSPCRVEVLPCRWSSTCEHMFA